MNLLFFDRFSSHLSRLSLSNSVHTIWFFGPIEVRYVVVFSLMSAVDVNGFQ